jgi:FkbM family methyltransferase
MWGRCYEDHVQQCLSALLSDGDVFIDIGAHIGYHAVLASSLVGPSGSVFAFEPDPSNFARLQDHLRPFSWGTALNKAAWSTTDTLLFERSSEPGESGWATLTTVRDLKRGEHIPVGTVSLDDWTAENCVGNVAAIKIDAEGSEVAILQGAQDVLDRAKPAVIAEANSVLLREAGTSSQELVQTLQARGYELFELQGKRLERLQLAQSPQSFEVLGVHAEKLDATMLKLQRYGIRERHQA